MHPRTWRSVFPLSVLLVVAACHSEQHAQTPAADATLSIERFRKDVETLSADDFEGRSPASAGEEKTVAYLVEQFKAAGAVGGNNGSFTQAVPLVAITATETSPLSISTEGETVVQLQQGEEVVTWTKRVVEQVAVEDAPLVFVGYGVVAPEYNWNDYAAVDVTGKTVVMLVNDPGFATDDPDLFTGRRMTYYGRWTYKFEEAARQGAAGAIVVHQTEAAGYPWSVVSGGWTGPQFDLARENGNADRAAFEGWISSAAATSLFESLGVDFAALAEAAAKPGFEAVSLPGAASVQINNEIAQSESNNVVALLPGDAAPDEVVAFSAHWDHLGVVDNGEQDGIYNGAVDNATGTAALLELARVLGREKHRRSLLFIAVTAEESGLLGSAWYAANPTVSLEKMAALINIDAMNVIGPTRDVTMIGYGSSTLQDYLEQAAAVQDRIVRDEPTPEKGFFYRSDHFNFAKHGVPVLYAKGGIDHIPNGAEYGAQRLAEHTANRYHQPSDEIHDGWDFEGLALDLELYREVAVRLANTDDWPRWAELSEFRATRAASASARAP